VLYRADIDGLRAIAVTSVVLFDTGLAAVGGGGPGFRTRSWFSWTNYAQSVRLLRTTGAGHRRVAELALMDSGTPLWYRLTVQLAPLRVVAVRMIAAGHFMHQRFYAFNEPLRIAPPN